MALINCKECGKVFAKTIGDTCPDCVRLRNQAIAKIDSVAYKSRDLSIDELATKAGLPLEQVRKLIAEGKVSSIKSLKAKCEMCGEETSVSTVTFLCKNCVSNIKSVQSKQEDKPQISRKPPGSGMKSRNKF